MKIVIISKAAFSFTLEGKSSLQVPLVMAGHTVQLVRPLVNELVGGGCKVGLIFPISNSIDDSTIYDSCDAVPRGARLFPYDCGGLPKTVHDISSLALGASLLSAMENLGGIDWILFVNAFPTTQLATEAIRQLKATQNAPLRVGVFLRGGDGYKWLDPSYVRSWFRDDKTALNVLSMYRRALRSANLVTTSSEWLRLRVEASGVQVHAVVPAPPVPKSGRTSYESKRTIQAEATPLHGRVDAESLWLVVSGRFHPDRRPDVAARAFAMARLDPLWSLVFAGCGDVSLVRRILDELSPDLQRRVSAITVPPRLLPDLYGAADAFLHTPIPTTAFTDSRPSALTSAAFHGKPVVAVLSGGISECISKTNVETLCVETNMAEAHTHTAERLGRKLEKLNSPILREVIGSSNENCSLTNGSIDSSKMIRSLLYEKVSLSDKIFS